MLSLKEISYIIKSVQLQPEQYWAEYMSPGEYNECYLFIKWALGEDKENPKYRHLSVERKNAVRKALNKYLLDRFD